MSLNHDHQVAVFSTVEINWAHLALTIQGILINRDKTKYNTGLNKLH